MWHFFALIVTMASPFHLMRRMEERLTGRAGPTPRDWAERAPAPIANFARPAALERDMWSARRRALGEDFWADHRASIDGERGGSRLRAFPRRRKFILEMLDGEESLYRHREGKDVVRRKVSPNVNASTQRRRR